MRIAILSRYGVGRLHSPDFINPSLVNVPHVVISITNPGDTDAEIGSCEHCRGVLRLQFHDVDDKYPTDDSKDLVAKKYICMVRSQADEIVRFVKSTPSDVIVVHCEAGQSRSSGIASALEVIFNGRDDHIWANPHYTPNMWCRKLVLDAWLDAD